MAVVTWNGSSSTDFATAANWDTGSIPTASDDVIIPDTSSINKCVLDQARNVNSFVLAADGEFDGGNTLFIKGKNAAGEAIKAQGKLGDVTDFTIETASAATVILTKQSGLGSFRDLRINHASADITLAAAMSLGRNLTITAGELDTSSSNHALTVAGEVNVAGTLTCNSSVCSFGSLASTGLTNLADSSGSTLITNENSDGLSIVAGTFGTCVPAKIKHNNGTVTFNNHSDPAAHAAIVCGNSNATDGLYNVIIDGANTIVDTYDPGGS
jgi:hypothetical protein